MRPPAGDAADASLVDVVIVSYESRDHVLAALRSIEAHAGVAVTVRVVDNASGDGTVETVRASAAVEVIANDRNVGFAAGCNQGWRAGSAPLVLFLNPDAELLPGALEALVRVLLERPRAGIAGPRTLNADGTVQISTGADLTPSSERAQRALVRGVAARRPAALAQADARHSREFQPDWVSGSCLMARRACLEAVGGFDEGFFLYEEDADLCRRARAAGWSVIFTPAAVVRHALGSSMAHDRARARLEYQRSHLRYYEKHLGTAARLALRAWLLARGAQRWLRGPRRSEGAALVALALRGR